MCVLITVTRKAFVVTEHAIAFRAGQVKNNFTIINVNNFRGRLFYKHEMQICLL